MASCPDNPNPGVPRLYQIKGFVFHRHLLTTPCSIVATTSMPGRTRDQLEIVSESPKPQPHPPHASMYSPSNDTSNFQGPKPNSRPLTTASFNLPPKRK